MRIAILKETRDGETRVAASPETIKKLTAAGHQIVIEAGAGDHASSPDRLFVEAGAEIAADAKATLKGADLLLKVRRPSAAELKLVPKGAGVVAFWSPHSDKALIEAAAKAGVVALSMEFTPRITRAQAMDALSSQANLAGYRAVIEGAALYGRGFPMMMTAAGTVAAAKCFVMGAGVAGLQAIATARRLGAIVTSTDVRPAAKEQVASLGAKFIAVEDEEFKAAETAAGYAKPMSAEYQAKQAILVGEHIAKQDVVITTALIPGRPAPVLVTPEMVAAMKPGSVIVDLAVEQGGNCPLSKADELVVTENGVTIAGFANLPGRLAADSSALYAKNLLNLLPLLTDADTKGFAPHFDDDIIQGMLLTRDGAVVHPSLTAA
ncbi:Re/Si-specific NAD(P)(+) transhydrogenase subunit alpha [Aquidulcibacter sp.]|uniref:Re/Si-specific NAD(P)(+) transhydrogenase subunit alpha n=1 Tax=Aquidulcibacter sp. TaxID=2052990 RepID=UPI0025BA5E9A|nr:Re/Si-specific NAD(P)(+) transhydrogenase subunit alpha [Aquidulcibacter sp.]MCA3696011.1 Re/Si-specific NAD(P)(+) transhydrogenase subunit alpha [Aquidulcibacter sp.]